MTEQFNFTLTCIGEGNGNPLQCSCLKNPKDGGAWWAAAYGVAQSRTRLKRLSSSSSWLARGATAVGQGLWKFCRWTTMPSPPSWQTPWSQWMRSQTSLAASAPAQHQPNVHQRTLGSPNSGAQWRSSQSARGSIALIPAPISRRSEL